MYPFCQLSVTGHGLLLVIIQKCLKSCSACIRERVQLPCGGLLDESWLHPVADAALQLMMVMTDNRLFFEILHRRTAHVQRLLKSEHLQ